MARTKFLRDKYVLPEEFEKLVKTAARWKPDMALMIYLAGALGLSAGEARRLERRSFRRLRGKHQVMVPSVYHRKSYRGTYPAERPVLVDKPTRKIIGKYLRAMPEGQRYLFPVQKRVEGGSPFVSSRAVRKWFKELVYMAKLNPKYTFHCLKRYRGLVLWRCTKDIRFIRKQLRYNHPPCAKQYIGMGD